MMTAVTAWTEKRVFITGHTGFKGAWLTLLLNRLGAITCGYALEPPTTPSLFELARVYSLGQNHLADVRDRVNLADKMAAFAPDVVFHMAAQSLVRESYAHPVETYEVNVMGTIFLLEAVQSCSSVKATIIVTSDKCYENRETSVAYCEHDPMGGHDPYSSSKGCTELVTSAYGRSFFMPTAKHGSLASVRAGNVIGGGDWAKDRVVCDLVRGLIAGEKVPIRHPNAIRPWQHVLDPLRGYLNVAENLVCHGPLAWEGWNFGPNESGERTVGMLAALICRLWGQADALEVQPGQGQLHEATLLKLNSSKARSRLGWQPHWDFEESVNQAIAWYRAYANGADMHSFTLRQIEDYLGSLAHSNRQKALA